ncbi:MAG: magnesium chelatase, partial [Croceitalea sp.]|nr:magnesium chelatase [Croceitalea sp.]
IEIAKKITTQEAQLDAAQSKAVYVPNLAMELLEQISFEARESEYVDAKSGVSARMSITALENLLSTAERRALRAKEEKTRIRLSDFMGVIPSITGKIELVYEGEQEGAGFVAETLIDDAIKTIFPTLFPEINKLERKDAETPYDDLVAWFFEQNEFELLDEEPDSEYQKKLDSIGPLTRLTNEYGDDIPEADKYFLKELLLWGLVAYNKLSKHRFENGVQFKDLYGSYISGL